MRSARVLPTTISAMAALLTGACAPQPRLQIGWYIDDPQTAAQAASDQALSSLASKPILGSASTGAAPDMTLFIVNRGHHDAWIDKVVVAGEAPWSVPGGHYRLGAHGGLTTVPFPLPSVNTNANQTTCRIPVELRVFWHGAPVSDDKGPKRRLSPPYRIEGKLPRWLLESWLTGCSLTVLPHSQDGDPAR